MKLHQTARGGAGRPAGDHLDADWRGRAVGQAKALVEPAEHHHPAKRGGQRGDEQAVVAPGGNAVDRTRGIAPQPIGDDPLTDPFLIRFAAFP